jgi:hypothetical protein
MKETPQVLDTITDVVLAYRPKSEQTGNVRYNPGMSNPMSLIQKIRLLATLNTLYNRVSALYAQNGGKMSPVKLTQIGSLIAQALASFGAAHFISTNMANTGWLMWALAGLNVVLTIGHALLPSALPAPDALPSTATKAGMIVLMLLSGPMLWPVSARAQAVAAPTGVQNIYAAGASYSINASPAVDGNALYAHSLNSAGTYAFTALDALPATLKPFTVTTNIGAGIAQKVFTLGSIPVYMPTAAGISWSGTNTGWQWSGGALASIHIKGNYYIMPSVRFLKSSVSGGTGYQPIIGLLAAWGK